MKNFKIIIFALVLILCLTVSLISCGGGSDEEASTDTTAAQNADDTAAGGEESESTPEGTSETTGSEGNAPADSKPAAVSDPMFEQYPEVNNSTWGNGDQGNSNTWTPNYNN